MIYETNSEDFYEDLKNNGGIYREYDFSNYNENNRLYSNHPKVETLKFNDELGGKIIHSVIALNSKLRSISIADKQELSAKGTTNYAQKSLKYSVFFRFFTKDAWLRTFNYTINSGKHSIFTLQTTKISLSCFDDQRYILPNCSDTLLFGHYSLREDAMFREFIEDIECGKDVDTDDIECGYWGRRRKRRWIFTLTKKIIPTDPHFHLLTPDAFLIQSLVTNFLT